MILSLVQTKGGTGKSTLSQCLAFGKPLRRSFATIGLIELDEQGSLKRWWQARTEHGRGTHNLSFFHLPHRDTDRIQREMETIMEAHELLILDVPGESVSRFHTSFACAISDMVLIPMRTSTNDEDAFEANLLPIVNQILTRHPEKQGSFFILPAFTHPLASTKNLFAYFGEILPDYLRCLNAVFPFRSIYENCNREGLNLYEYTALVNTNKRERKQAKNACRDIAAICEEILRGAS